MIPSLLLTTLALAAAPDPLPPAEPPSTLLESYGPLSSSPRDDFDKTVILLGGVLRKADADEYLRLLNTGADPGTVAGPERIYAARAENGKLTDLKPAFQLSGYHVNDPSSFRPLGSKRLYMYFTRGANKVAEKCRKEELPLRLCADYLLAREIGLASSDDEGRTWRFERVVVDPKSSGDGTGAGQPSALYVGDEVWLYYTTGVQTFTKENVFRLRLSLDGAKRLAEPEPLKIKGFAPGLSLESVQLVRLKCGGGSGFVSTMVANNRQQTALLFYLTTDGLHFRGSPEAPSIVPYAEHSLASPTQMPGPASAEECAARDASGIPTYRELYYAEQRSGDSWLLRRAALRLNLP